MTPDQLLFVYVSVLLGTLGGLAWFSEMRRKRFKPEPSEDRIFRCERCAFVYTDDPDVDRSRCPQCSTMNDPVQF
jgi:rubrerythrin